MVTIFIEVEKSIFF